MTKHTFGTLTKKQLEKVFMYHVNAPLLSDDDKREAEALLNQRIRISEALNLLDIPLNTLQRNYSNIALQVDVTQRVLDDKFKITEKEWSKAEKEVKAENKKQLEKMKDAILDKVKSNQGAIMDKVKKSDKDKVVPFKAKKLDKDKVVPFKDGDKK